MVLPIVPPATVPPVFQQNYGHVVGSASLDGAFDQGFDLSLQSSSAVQDFNDSRVVDRAIQTVGADEDAVAGLQSLDVRANQDVVERAHRHGEYLAIGDGEQPLLAEAELGAQFVAVILV